MAEAVSGLKSEIKAAHTQLDEMTAKPAEAALAEVAKDVKQNTETIREALDSAKEKLLISSSTAPALNQELAEVKNMAKDTEVKAMEVLVAQHLAGDKSVTSEEVRQELQNTLTTAATEIAANKENVSDVKDIVNAAKAEVKDLAKDHTVSATSTKELSDKISNVAAQTKDATAKSEQVTIDAEKNITEGKAAMAQGDLTKALGAVKALAEQTKESEKLKDSVMASAQSVLPAVAVVKDAPVVTPSTTLPVVSSTAPAVNVKK
jgi:chromosome segregation ATPase